MTFLQHLGILSGIVERVGMIFVDSIHCADWSLMYYCVQYEVLWLVGLILNQVTTFRLFVMQIDDGIALRDDDSFNSWLKHTLKTLQIW